MTGKLVAAALGLGFAAGCSGDHMDGDDESAMRQDIQAARAELTRHHQAVNLAASLDVAMADVERHDDQMTEAMSGMQSAMQHMSHCSSSGMADMHDMMSGVDSDMQQHRESMMAASTLEDARAFCTTHFESMSGMMDAMHDATERMGCMSGD